VVWEPFIAHRCTCFRPEDYRFNALAGQVGYGWVRFPGGSSSDVYNSQTGFVPANWLAPFASYSAGPSPNVLAHVSGRGGAQVLNGANRASLFGASLIMCANGFTDTPQSIGQFAAYAKANHLPVAVWELSNEPYLFSGFFSDATAYLDQMRPYRDAIKAADPNAVISIFVRDPGTAAKVNPWNTAVANYPNKYWDAISFHFYPPQSTGDITIWMADENANLATKSISLISDYMGPLATPGMKFIISEFNPTLGAGGPTGVPSLTNGSLWGGIYAAEFTMRMSTVPSVQYVGANEIPSFAGVQATTDHFNDVTDAYNAGTSIDTVTLDFGFFTAAQAAGTSVLNSVINSAAVSNKTTVTGGVNVPATGIAGGIPALYAMSYSNARGATSVVVTNKSNTPHQVTIRMNGTALAGPFPLQFVTGTVAGTMNTGAAPNAISMQSGVSGNPVTIPPYSVVRVDLPAQAVQMRRCWCNPPRPPAAAPP
jgi:hypothetical protein